MTAYDKASWTEENTHIYCDLAVEQIRAGNCLHGIMSRRGYNMMRQGFLLKTGLNLSVKQLRNRWTQCKTLYSLWTMLNTSTALGRRPNGTIIASAAWWKRELEVTESVFTPMYCFLSCCYVSDYLFLFFREDLNARSSCMVFLLM